MYDVVFYYSKGVYESQISGLADVNPPDVTLCSEPTPLLPVGVLNYRVISGGYVRQSSNLALKSAVCDSLGFVGLATERGTLT